MALTPRSVPVPQLQARPAPIWTYLVADLRTGAILDELPLTGVRWSKKLCASGSLSASWQLGPATTRDAYTLTTPCKTAIYAVRDSVPMWGGIIWTRSYDSSTGKLGISAGDWWTYFNHRKVIPFLTTYAGDTAFVAKQQVTYVDLDQNDVAEALVSLAQSHQGGDIGIQVDSTGSGILRDRTYHGYELASVGDVLGKLASVENGPDMMFDVAQGPTDQPRRLLRLGSPWLGQQGSAHVWEVGGNVESYTWPSDGSAMATRTYAVGNGIEDAAPIAFTEDFSRYNAGWPLLEAETGYTTVSDPGTLNAHAAADLQAARLPVVLPKLTVRGDLPPYLGEFGPGDDGRLVVPAGDAFHTGGLDTTVRVVAMDVTPESDSGERVELTCAPVLEDVV